MNEIIRSWWQSAVEPLRQRVEVAIAELDEISGELERAGPEHQDAALGAKLAATREALVALKQEKLLNGADQLIKPLEEQLRARQRDQQAEAIASAIGRLVEQLLEDDGAAIQALGLDLGGTSVPAGGAAAPATGDSAAAAAISPEDMPWIESNECTSCDDCITINRSIFAYDDAKLAFIKDPRGGPFRDLVKAAEKCPSGIIHPGKPLNPKEKDLAKWVKRAEKYQ